ncbi:polysaccharide deacetylase [Ensifer sp. ENS05]|uniref:polysaccharide deacetylase family protein n=1 Tax=Ensifer sp. ENS05 TaxID=2769277 RepID=UPI0017813115|nr:polysaccharide deacetylase [Ensifer sp. ENS05]MBD9596927.1 polysaccharide deacetylase [Ensifer sp. ENS05]
MNVPDSSEPWEWPEATWRRIVNRVRAGRALKPNAWKDGMRCAVAFSFDSDHETNELRDGGRAIERLSWGEFGSRVGIPRILDILHRHDVRASFFVPAVAALLHEEEQRRIAGRGHEIGMHGWIHELCNRLPMDAERDLMLRSADTLERISGVRPVGMRTPGWDFSVNTLKLQQELGIKYDSSLMADEDCYELLLDGQPTGIVELPVEWHRSDSVYFLTMRGPGPRPHLSPSEVFEIFRREFDAAYAAGGIFQVTFHPHIIGHRSRIWILEELVRYVKSKGDCWCTSHAEISAFAAENSSL